MKAPRACHPPGPESAFPSLLVGGDEGVDLDAEFGAQGPADEVELRDDRAEANTEVFQAAADRLADPVGLVGAQ